MAASPFKADPNEASDPTRIEAIQSSPPPKTQRPGSNQVNSGRLKPPTDRSHNTSTRLKFNAPGKGKGGGHKHDPEHQNLHSTEKDKSPKTKKAGSGTSRNNPDLNHRKSSTVTTEESKTTVAAQKASSSRLAQSKQLFRKANASAIPKADGLKSMETKEPQSNKGSVRNEDLKMWGQSTSDQPRDSPPIVSDRVSSQGMLNRDSAPANESSMYDEREDSIIEKNSIAEFEQLEKECFQEEAATKHINLSKQTPLGAKGKTRKSQLDGQGKHSSNVASSKTFAIATKSVDKLEQIEESPVRQSARELLNNLKSASPDKLSSAFQSEDESKIERLENQLMALITEQESEVARLKEENSRVATLQSECQRQLERLNREASEQEKSKKNASADVKKLKTQLKSKEEEIIRL